MAMSASLFVHRSKSNNTELTHEMSRVIPCEISDQRMKMRTSVTVSRQCVAGEIDVVTMFQPGVTVAERQILPVTLLPKLYVIPPDVKPYEIVTDGVRI